MSATSRINPDSFYVNGVPIPASYFIGVDTAQSQSVNGDAGGTWVPIAPINIAGTGMWCAGPWSTGTNQKITTPLGSSKRIVLAANDLLELAPSHVLSSRQIVTPCSVGASCSGGVPARQTGTQASAVSGVTDEFMTAFVGRGQGSRWLVPLRVHHGAKFTTATLSFYVTQQHQFGNLPSMPRLRIYALAAGGGITTLGGSSTASGFATFPVPATLAAYQGQLLSFVYPIIPGVVIARDKFAYLAEIVDESNGTGVPSTPGNIYKQILCQFTTISSLGFG